MSTYVRPIYDSYSVSTRDRSSDEKWDRGDTHTTWSVNGAKLGEGYLAVEYEGEVKPGDIVHLLYVVYSTGDTFGRDEDGSIDFISVHKNHDVALENRLKLEKVNRCDNPSVTLKTDDGQEFSYYAPWTGYFESLGYIDIHSCVVQGE